MHLTNLFRNITHSRESAPLEVPAPSPTLVIAGLQAELGTENKKDALTHLAAIVQSTSPVEVRLAAAHALGSCIHDQRSYTALLPLIDPSGEKEVRLIDYQSRIKVLELLKPVLHIPIVERTCLNLLSSPDRNYEVRLPALKILAAQLFKQVEEGSEPSRALITLVLFGKDKNKEVECHRGEVRLHLAARYPEQYRAFAKKFQTPSQFARLLPREEQDIFEKSLDDHCGDLARRVIGASLKPRGETLASLMASRELPPHEQKRILETLELECEAVLSGHHGDKTPKLFQQIVHFFREAKHDPALPEMRELELTLKKKFPEFDFASGAAELDSFQREGEQRVYQRRKIQCSILLTERFPRLAREARLEGAPEAAFQEALELLASGTEFNLVKRPHIELLGLIGVALLKTDMPRFFRSLERGLSSYPQLEPHLKLALDMPIGFHSKALQEALHSIFRSENRGRAVEEQISLLQAIAQKEQAHLERRSATSERERRFIDVYTVTRATRAPDTLLRFMEDYGLSKAAPNRSSGQSGEQLHIINPKELEVIGQSLALLIVTSQQARDKVIAKFADELTSKGKAYLYQALEKAFGEEAAFKFQLELQRYEASSTHK